MIRINHKMIEPLEEKARVSNRLRTNYNFHSESSDLLQRMLNVMEPDTYCRPHKHENPDKREAFIILKGKIAVLEFDDSGNISASITLSHELGNYACEIAPGSWHAIIALEPGSVVYEIKDGPYDPATDKKFAKWSPAEGDPASHAYLQNLKSLLAKLN